MSVQVLELINQSVVSNKTRLEQALVQIFVQVWKKSKSNVDYIKLFAATIDLLCFLRERDLSANVLNTALKYGATYDLKRKIIIPLIQLGYIAMTYPDKPRSAKQTYTLTDKGRTLFC